MDLRHRVRWTLRVMIETETPTELIQHYVYGRSSHRRNVASSHIINMVWLYRLRRGGGGQHPVGGGQWEDRKLQNYQNWDCEPSADDVLRRECAGRAVNLLMYDRGGILYFYILYFYHRVDRVLSFFSSRRNWDSPNPSPAGECASPVLWGGAHSLARGGGGRVPIPTRGHTLWYSLYIRTLWLLHTTVH